MKTKTIAAKDVKPGMYVYNIGEKHPYTWSRVYEVNWVDTVYHLEGGEMATGDAIQVVAGATRQFHPREGVFIGEIE